MLGGCAGEVSARGSNKEPIFCEDVLHHRSVDVGEAVVAALEAVGEPGVVEAEQVQGGRVQVVDVDGVFDDVVAEVVRGAVA